MVLVIYPDELARAKSELAKTNHTILLWVFLIGLILFFIFYGIGKIGERGKKPISYGPQSEDNSPQSFSQWNSYNSVPERRGTAAYQNSTSAVSPPLDELNSVKTPQRWERFGEDISISEKEVTPPGSWWTTSEDSLSSQLTPDDDDIIYDETAKFIILEEERLVREAEAAAKAEEEALASEAFAEAEYYEE